MNTSKKYFSTLNYTLANEDTALELGLLPKGAGHLFSVAGSGGRILPLLARHPKMVSCVDVSIEQLYLTELRFESVRALTHSEFLAFWGYPPRSAIPEERRALFDRIRLSDPAWGYLSRLFKENDWNSILYLGKWERTFQTLSRINRKLTGIKGAGLFNALTEQEQARYFEAEFPRKAWKLVLLLLGNAGVFNALLYKGSFPKKNIPQSFFSFYEATMDRLFRTGLARENFFLQLLFFGKVVYGEGCPVECRPEVFAEAKAALSNAEIRYCHGDLLGEAAKAPRPIDFFSFSDVPSYFSGETERNFLQQVAPKLAPGALAVVRNYLHVPEGLNTKGFEHVSNDHREAIDREKVGVYLVDIYRWNA